MTIQIYIFSYFADRYKNSRTIILPISCLPVILGAIVIWKAPWHPTVGPLIGYYFVAVSPRLSGYADASPTARLTSSFLQSRPATLPAPRRRPLPRAPSSSATTPETSLLHTSFSPKRSLSNTARRGSRSWSVWSFQSWPVLLYGICSAGKTPDGTACFGHKTRPSRARRTVRARSMLCRNRSALEATKTRRISSVQSLGTHCRADIRGGNITLAKVNGIIYV